MEGTKIFPFFHLAIPLILFEVPYIKKKYRVNRFALIIGSIFPDLIDKITLLLRLANGRGHFHSLLLVLICFGILFLFTKGNKPVSVSFLIGMLIHLLLDLPGIPLFFPFVHYDFMYVHDPIPYWINSLLTNPIIQITELLGIIALIFIIINNKLFGFKKIVEYLKSPSEIVKIIEPEQEIVIVED